MLAQDAREHARRLLRALLMTVALRLGRLCRMVGGVGGGIVVHVGQRKKPRVEDAMLDEGAGDVVLARFGDRGTSTLGRAIKTESSSTTDALKELNSTRSETSKGRCRKLRQIRDAQRGAREGKPQAFLKGSHKRPLDPREGRGTWRAKSSAQLPVVYNFSA